jgi:hypothetical protein
MKRKGIRDQGSGIRDQGSGISKSVGQMKCFSKRVVFEKFCASVQYREFLAVSESFSIPDP